MCVCMYVCICMYIPIIDAYACVCVCGRLQCPSVYSVGAHQPQRKAMVGPLDVGAARTAANAKDLRE